jgi:hypothetical protein
MLVHVIIYDIVLASLIVRITFHIVRRVRVVSPVLLFFLLTLTVALLVVVPKVQAFGPMVLLMVRMTTTV